MDGSAAHSGCSASLMERKMSAMACEVFNELRLEGKLCDVIIEVNGCQFNAHKNILCSCSHYFRSVLGMLYSGNRGRRHCPVVLWCLRCYSPNVVQGGRCMA